MSTLPAFTRADIDHLQRGTPAKKAPPATFHAHGKDWFPHTPGDPMPCDPTREVWVLFRDRPSNFSSKKWNWHDLNIDEPMEQIIGWRYATPQPEQPDELETLRAELHDAHAQNLALRDVVDKLAESVRECVGECDRMTQDGIRSRAHKALAAFEALSSPPPPVVSLEDCRPLVDALRKMLRGLPHGDDCAWLNLANAPCDCGTESAETALATFTTKHPL